MLTSTGSFDLRQARGDNKERISASPKRYESTSQSAVESRRDAQSLMRSVAGRLLTSALSRAHKVQRRPRFLMTALAQQGPSMQEVGAILRRQPQIILGSASASRRSAHTVAQHALVSCTSSDIATLLVPRRHHGPACGRA